MDEDELPLNSSRPPPRGWRWRKTSVYLKAFWLWRFFRVPPAKVHDDDDQNDLEKNITPVRQPPASAPVALPAGSFPLVNPIKRIISRIVRAAKRVTDEIPQEELQEQQRRYSKYSQKALMFAITMFVAYLGSSSASPSIGSIDFKVAMAAFFVAITIDLISITRAPKWGFALVYLSWFLLVVLSYLLLVSFHKDYRCAIIPVLLLFFAALLRRKLRPSVVGQQNTTGTRPDHQDLEDIFDTAAAIVNSGGLISIILGHYMYMVGPDNHLTEVSAIGFLFFFTVVVGLYLMMAATVRNAALTLYAWCHAYYVLGFLLVATLIATVIRVSWLSRNGSHV